MSRYSSSRPPARGGKGRRRAAQPAPSRRRTAAAPSSRRLIDYPRWGRSGIARWVPSWKQVLSVMGAGFVMLAGLFAVAYAMTPIPDVNELAETESTILYYSDGKTELGRLGQTHREPVELEKVPDHVEHAVLAAENRSFYTDNGVSPRGIARALWTNLRGDSVSGGSTITQQYVKNVHLSQERTLTRKAKEFFIALKVDKQVSKDQILEDYLNIAWFGRGATGLQAGSKAYFDKPVEELSVQEGAMLAAVIRSPSLYNPDEDPDRVAARMEYVYDGMEQEGWLDPADRPEPGLPESLKTYERTNRLGGPTGYLIDEVEKDLVALGFEDKEINTGGLKVRTTFDKKAQDAAVKAVANQRAEGGELADDDGLQVGLAAVEPGTGAVRAMYGGEDYVTHTYNNATRAEPPAGSTFKPYALAAGLEEGVGLKSRFDGSSPREFDVGLEDGQFYRVENYGDSGGKSYGEIDLLEATAKSVNTPFVDLGLSLGDTVTEGPGKVVDAAERAGIPEACDANDPEPPSTCTKGLTAHPSVVLGPASTHVIDVANSYATFAAQGERADHYVVEEVLGSNGGQLYKAKPETERAFDQDITADVTYALQGVVEDGSGKEAQRLGRPSAGKTGTAQDTKAVWYTGYVPQMSASVSVFKTNEKGNLVSLKEESALSPATGGNAPAKIWTDFMTMYLDGQPVEKFPEPAWVGDTLNPKPTATPTPTGPPTPTEKPRGRPEPLVTETTKPGNGNKSTPTETTTTEPTAEPLPDDPTTIEPTLPGGGGGGGGGGSGG